MIYERWVKSGLLGSGIDAHYDITRVTDTSHGPVIAQVLTSHVTEESRRTASHRADLICSIPELMAQADAAEHERDELRAANATLEAEIKRLRDGYETLQEMYRADHDQRIRQEETIKQLNSEIAYLRSTDHAADLAFERMPPLDWRDNEVTP